MIARNIKKYTKKQIHSTVTSVCRDKRWKYYKSAGLDCKIVNAMHSIDNVALPFMTLRVINSNLDSWTQFETKEISQTHNLWINSHHFCFVHAKPFKLISAIIQFIITGIWNDCKSNTIITWIKSRKCRIDM